MSKIGIRTATNAMERRLAPTVSSQMYSAIIPLTLPGPDDFEGCWLTVDYTLFCEIAHLNAGIQNYMYGIRI